MSEESKYMYYMLRDIAKLEMEEANNFKKLMMRRNPRLEKAETCKKPEKRQEKKV